MPFEIQLADDGVGMIVSAIGDITEDEYVRFYSSLLTRPAEAVSHLRYSIHDYTGITSVKISARAVHRIAEQTKLSGANPPVVAVVANPGVVFGLARMWEIQASDVVPNIMVFRNRADAEAWITACVKKRFGNADLAFG